MAKKGFMFSQNLMEELGSLQNEANSYSSQGSWTDSQYFVESQESGYQVYSSLVVSYATTITSHFSLFLWYLFILRRRISCRSRFFQKGRTLHFHDLQVAQIFHYPSDLPFQQILATNPPMLLTNKIILQDGIFIHPQDQAPLRRVKPWNEI